MRIRVLNYIHSHLPYSVATVFTGLTIFNASAQETFNDSIPDNIVSLDETVITAAKLSESLTSTTPTFIIDETAILKKGITDISDAIHRLPGLIIRDYGGAGGMKTVSARGLGASHTSIIYDGLPVSDLQNGAVDISRFTIDNISGIELVVGDNNDIFVPVRVASAPASLSINALSILKEAPMSFTGKLKFGSFGYISPSLEFTKKIEKNLAIGVSGDFIHIKNNYPFKIKYGKETTVEHRENNRMNSGHAEGNISLTYGKGSSLSLKLYYYDNDRQLPGPVIYYNVGASKEELRDRNIFGQIENIYCFTPVWKLRVGAKFNWAATLYSDKNRQEEEGYYKENYFQREYYATANLLFNPTKSWSFDYSLDYGYNNLNSNQKIDSRPWRHSVLQSLSAKFINNRFTAIARMILSVYDGGSAIAANAGGTDYTHLSPSLSLSSKLLSNGLLFGRISYKNIFRMPTFNEAYFKHFGSPDLKPESTHQLNIGLTYQLPSISWLPYTSITIDGYRNIVKDRIVAIPYNMFVWTITNLKNVNVWGADVTLNSTFKINEKQQLLLSGTWSYQRAMINASKGELLWHKQVAYTPLNSGAFSLSYENPWVNLVIHGQGLSSRYTENSNIAQSHLPGYFEFGVTLWKTFRWRQQSLEARVDINNILDKQYVIIARYPMPGRSLMISLKYSI